jgi:hypothetical protein
MSADELRNATQRQPFEPFRLVMTAGVGYEIRHPDLLWVGKRSANVGLTGNPAQTYYEREIKIDLLHIIRLEPLEPSQSPSKNGPV